MTSLAPTLGDIISNLHRPAVGAWVKLSGDESCEIMARSGFDFLIVDLEHSRISMESAYKLVATISLAGSTALVRVPELNRVIYQRLLDAGTGAILAPLLDNVPDIRAGLSFTRYPPLGTRGFATTTRAGEWGMRAADDHIMRSNSAITFIPQLESRIALERVADIASIDGLGAMFIGRADLSVSMGIAIDDPEIGRLVSSTVSVCRDRNIVLGTATNDIDSARALGNDGFDFIVVGDDAGMLARSARSLAVGARTALGQVGPSTDLASRERARAEMSFEERSQ